MRLLLLTPNNRYICRGRRIQMCSLLSARNMPSGTLQVNRETEREVRIRRSPASKNTAFFVVLTGYFRMFRSGTQDKPCSFTPRSGQLASRTRCACILIKRTPNAWHAHRHTEVKELLSHIWYDVCSCRRIHDDVQGGGTAVHPGLGAGSERSILPSKLAGGSIIHEDQVCEFFRLPGTWCVWWSHGRELPSCNELADCLSSHVCSFSLCLDVRMWTHKKNHVPSRRRKR
jgi:hypothetical protein